LTTRITNNLLDGQKVYAAQILAGATIALAKSVNDMSATTDIAIKSLNKLHGQNPVWHGLPKRALEVKYLNGWRERNASTDSSLCTSIAVIESSTTGKLYFVYTSYLLRGITIDRSFEFFTTC
jgi:hypothetical protein